MVKIFALFLILPSIAIYEQSKSLGWKIVLVYCVTINLLAYLLNWHDKRQARKQGGRIPEKSLHLVELLGGWPAAFVAQQQLRHKTSKRAYQRGFWSIVCLHQYLAFEIISDWRIAHTVLSLF